MTPRGNIPVKKYKTNKKMVQATGSYLTYASFALAQGEDMGTVLVEVACTCRPFSEAEPLAHQ